jgi:hypothetical protein
MAAWPNQFTEGSKSGKKNPLPIDLSTKNNNYTKTMHFRIDSNAFVRGYLY